METSCTPLMNHPKIRGDENLYIIIEKFFLSPKFTSSLPLFTDPQILIIYSHRQTRNDKILDYLLDLLINRCLDYESIR